MRNLISQLIIYREFDEDSILVRLADLCGRFESGDYERGELTSAILEQIHRLLALATRYGFDGNLWHNYLAYLLAATITPFTLVAEKTGARDGSVNAFARSDFRIFKQLFDYDFTPLEKVLDINCFSIITHYHAVVKKEQIYNKNVSEKVRELSDAFARAESDDELYACVTGFYRRCGVGKFGLNKAFRVGDDPRGELLQPITNTSDVRLEDLVGYEDQKRLLCENTEAFLHGRRANNVLLYGDAGTGKSTCVKAVLNRYYDDGLRMIEIYKHQFKELSRIVNEIKNRNYRFILTMDDLSFEDFETDYKYLKAVIEGGLEPNPENVLIYATSNRRHLIRESWRDKFDESDDDLHRSDTVQEKLSLADRFGLAIGFFAPTPDEYLEIVRVLAARCPEITMPRDELERRARAWELQHGSFSGRTAQQFVNYLAGTAGR
ncbi:MAG: ATP-binding protein [Anaerovoracaceae bacterium]|jgi:predicted AAA+ superfamily ATPase